MTTETNYGAKVAAAFVKAQAAFGPALKAKDNPFFKSKYADLASCVEAVSEGLHSNGIAFTQQTFTDETGVTVQTVLIHESGEQLCSGRLHVPAVKNDAQAYGSALTYARRYSLMAICGIAPEDDDGNAATSAKAPERAKQKHNAGDSRNLVLELCKQATEATTDDALREIWEKATVNRKAGILDDDQCVKIQLATKARNAVLHATDSADEVTIDPGF